jgi:hypothetical protein
MVLSLFESVKVTASKNFGIDFGSSNLLHYFFTISTATTTLLFSGDQLAAATDALAER